MTGSPALVHGSSSMGRNAFLLIVVLLALAAILRSSLATKLDGFTMDEPWHITAGVSYARRGDFRLNPEHPPFVKLWVGSYIAATGFHLSEFRPFADKPDERDFVEQDVYLNNDSNSVQRHARQAMFALNGLLLLVLSLAVWRIFGAIVALGTLLFLVIDPTVAAHLPVVMTDLPVALLASSAILFGIRAFRHWEWTDVFATTTCLGLALATKHSAPIFFFIVIGMGVFAVLRGRKAGSESDWAVGVSRLRKIAVIGIGAVVILWAAYLFRFAESTSGHEVFNRPLADKIADVRSPLYRLPLKLLAASHALPRAYIWGFADTIGAGLQGHLAPVWAFGKGYWGNGPKYFFPAVIVLKLPIGLSLLALIGLGLYVLRKVPAEWRRGLGSIAAALILYLLVLATGSTYGGIRHALPAIVLLAVIAGVGMHVSLLSGSKSFRYASVIFLIAAAISAVPIMRPWEYYNAFAGGPANAYLYFNDEGVDLGQRGKELASYYQRVIRPSNEEVRTIVLLPPAAVKALGMEHTEPRPDQQAMQDGSISGFVVISSRYLSKQPFWDNSVLRDSEPIARFGNAFVYHGTRKSPAIIAPGLFFGSLGAIYSPNPDLESAEQMLKASIALDPSPFFVHLQLGNVYLRRGMRNEAEAAYFEASRRAAEVPEQQRLLNDQLARLRSGVPMDKISDLRNPAME